MISSGAMSFPNPRAFVDAKERPPQIPPACFFGRWLFLGEGKCKRMPGCRAAIGIQSDCSTWMSLSSSPLLRFLSTFTLEALDSGERAALQLTNPCRPHRGPALLHPPHGNFTNSSRPHRTPKALAHGDSGPVTSQCQEGSLPTSKRCSGEAV
jgi:hypothetical protein